jgi:hypothetical protein
MIHFAMPLTHTETWLAAFHDANPGAPSRAFDALPALCSEQAFASTCDSKNRYPQFSARAAR